jgi:hypothetical protein
MSTKPIRSFVDMLGLLNRGRFIEKCDEHLTEAINHLEALPGEKGTAKLTLEVTVVFDTGRVDIKPSIKSKLPEEKAFSETPFWTIEGGLSVQHPSQIDMFAGPRDATERGQARDQARNSDTA